MQSIFKKIFFKYTSFAKTPFKLFYCGC